MCMVCDGTKSGSNKVLFASWSPLATVNTTLCTVEPGAWLADNDFWEMFPNFWFHPCLRPCTGLDITSLFPDELKGQGKDAKLWEACIRCVMGPLPSPHQATQSAQCTKRLILGDHLDPKIHSDGNKWNSTCQATRAMNLCCPVCKSSERKGQWLQKPIPTWMI